MLNNFNKIYAKIIAECNSKKFSKRLIKEQAETGFDIDAIIDGIEKQKFNLVYFGNETDSRIYSFEYDAAGLYMIYDQSSQPMQSGTELLDEPVTFVELKDELATLVDVFESDAGAITFVKVGDVNTWFNSFRSGSANIDRFTKNI